MWLCDKQNEWNTLVNSSNRHCECHARKKNKIGIIFDFRTFSRHFIEWLERLMWVSRFENVVSSVVLLLSKTNDYARQHYDDIYNTIGVCVCARFFRHTAATAYRKWEQIFMTNDKSRTSLQKQTPHFVCSLIYILFGWRFFFLMRSSVAVSHLSWFSSFLSIPFGLCTRLSILTVKWIHFFWLSNWMHCSGFHFYELTILISDVKCHVVWQCHLQRAYLILILVYNMWCLLYLCIC